MTVRGLIGLYSGRSGILLTGTPKAFLDLGRLINSLDQNSISVVFDTENVKIAPYAAAFKNLLLEKVEGAKTLLVKPVGDTLEIKGWEVGLSIISDIIIGLAEIALEHPDKEPSHVHIEYYPEHYYLDPSSEPMVVEIDNR